jgi:hypothetical protein
MAGIMLVLSALIVLDALRRWYVLLGSAAMRPKASLTAEESA